VIKELVVRSIVPYEYFGLSCRSWRYRLCVRCYRRLTSHLGSFPCGRQCVKGVSLLCGGLGSIYQSSRHTEPSPYRLADFTRGAVLYHTQQVATASAPWHCSGSKLLKNSCGILFGGLLRALNSIPYNYYRPAHGVLLLYALLLHSLLPWNRRWDRFL
jgi:hypothetical protein